MFNNKNKKIKILGVTPARGGSKGLPRKNIKPLNGKPLIAYTIEQALKSKYLDKYIVATEDNEIAEISKKYGAEIFELPEEFTTDKSAHEPGLIYILDSLQKNNENFDILVMLQATTPFRIAKTIDGVIEKLINSNNTDSVVSMYEAPQHLSPHWASIIDEDGYARPFAGGSYIPVRQSLPKHYWRDGQAYAVFADKLKSSGSRYGHRGPVPYFTDYDKYHINIDGETDFWLAEILINKGLIK